MVDSAVSVQVPSRYDKNASMESTIQYVAFLSGPGVLSRRQREELCRQLDIDSHAINALSYEEKEAARKVAQNLGELWPE